MLKLTLSIIINLINYYNITINWKFELNVNIKVFIFRSLNYIKCNFKFRVDQTQGRSTIIKNHIFVYTFLN